MNTDSFPPIETLLPHSAPMILLSRVIEYQGTSITCEVSVTKESFLYNETLAGVPPQVGIEYMAQTIAALAGIEAVNDGGKPPIGFLLGARRYSHQGECFKENCQYQVLAEELMRDSNMAVYQCTIEDNQHNVVASGQVNTVVAEQDILKQLKE